MGRTRGVSRWRQHRATIIVLCALALVVLLSRPIFTLLLFIDQRLQPPLLQPAWVFTGNGLKPTWADKDILVWDTSLSPEGEGLYVLTDAPELLLVSAEGKIVRRTRLKHEPASYSQIVFGASGNSYVTSHDYVEAISGGGEELWGYSLEHVTKYSGAAESADVIVEFNNNSDRLIGIIGMTSMGHPAWLMAHSYDLFHPSLESRVLALYPFVKSQRQESFFTLVWSMPRFTLEKLSLNGQLLHSYKMPFDIDSIIQDTGSCSDLGNQTEVFSTHYYWSGDNDTGILDSISVDTQGKQLFRSNRKGADVHAQQLVNPRCIAISTYERYVIDEIGATRKSAVHPGYLLGVAETGSGFLAVGHVIKYPPVVHGIVSYLAGFSFLNTHSVDTDTLQLGILSRDGVPQQVWTIPEVPYYLTWSSKFHYLDETMMFANLHISNSGGVDIALRGYQVPAKSKNGLSTPD